ncbi:mitogen-activated protein kinase [Saitozyma sp. JCM 24511]|nr:mitogen-activated protein kinase [Saitozyma sp. JCM 24511]
MASPVATSNMRPHSPSSSPLTPPLTMVPRSRPSRPQSEPSASPANARSPPSRSRPPQPTSTSSSSASASASASSSRMASNSVSEPTPITSASTSTAHDAKSAAGGSSSSNHHLYRGSKSQPVTASSSTSVHGLLASVASLAPMTTATSTPQTGASKMAAAAKRGHAGIEGLPGKQEEEDHPLSEKCLRERDYQTIHTLNRLFHLPSRWRLVRPLGQGAYGLVISVQDSLSGEPVAVKCITRVFDKVILARRALREITLLRHFGGHENLTGLIDLDHVWEGYNEIYLYMEPMEADLHQIVRSGQALSNSHIQYFLYQLLRGMKYIHSANVIHRDLKPGNLLVNSDCELKICDFGLARGFKPVESGDGDELKLTEYVATRWYRAPEVMLSNRRYTTASCILAELLGGKPLFKGKEWVLAFMSVYVDQLNLILGVLGTPDEDTLQRVGSEKACAYIRSLPHSEPVPLQLILPDAEPHGRSPPSLAWTWTSQSAFTDLSALDLLNQLLAFDPSERITVEQALAHPYVGTYHDESDEPACHSTFDKWEDVESLTTIEELRAAISREINEFREEVRTLDEDSEQEGEEYEEGGTTYMVEDNSQAIVDSPMPEAGATIPLPPGPGHSPKQSLHDIGLGVSPKTVTSALPIQRARSRDREATPQTPGTAFSEDSFSAPAPSSGRASRRTSTHSIHRRPNSFLFSSPLGAGMTPLQSMSMITSDRERAERGRESAVSSASVSTGGGPGTASYRPLPRSRAPSSTGEFASLRPLIRSLSVVGIDQELRRLEDGERRGSLSGRRGSTAGENHSEVPPMSVSPSDAPPSEPFKSPSPSLLTRNAMADNEQVPKSFGHPSRPPSVPPPLPLDAPPSPGN